MRNFIREGYGTHNYASGDKYEGDWVDGKRHGKGKIAFKNGAKYEGTFVEDEATGDGTFIDKNSNVFSILERSKGGFVRGELFGEGKATMKGGDEYIGQFKSGKFNGQGKMIYQALPGHAQHIKDRAIYDGNWINGTKSGFGTMKWSDGTLFEGEWKEDNRVYGKLKMVVGYIHEGPWLNGLIHGPGKLTLKSGTVFECFLEKAKIPAQGKMIYKDGNVYVGTVADFRREGKGKLTEPNHTIYHGYFSNDRRNGPGVMWYPNGDVYVGEFISDKRQGFGQFYEAKKGMLYEGNWESDKKRGDANLRFEDGRKLKVFFENDATYYIKKDDDD